jgi:predicted RND superfamily exporter protein
VSRIAALHRRIEDRFVHWGAHVARRAWWWIAGCSALTAALGSLLPGIRFDNSLESFLRSGDPSMERYDVFRAQFGRDERIVIGLAAPDVFAPELLERLRRLHEDIEREVPYVEDVLSLVNVRLTRGLEDELVVESLRDHWTRKPEELARLREFVLATPLYRNLLVSEDADFTTIVIQPFTYSTKAEAGDPLGGFGDEADAGAASEGPAYLTEAEARELVAALEQVVARHRSSEHPLWMVGGPVMGVRTNQMLGRDIQRFVLASIAAIAVLLALLFRRISGVVLPLTVVLASLASCLGLLVVLDIPLSLTLGTLPAFLLAVGICDAVHLLVIVYRELAAGRPKPDSIAFALGHSGLAIVMTSLTTAGGLVSFVFAELQHIHDLGIVAPIGVLLALAYSLTLLPALLAVVPLEARARAQGRHGGRATDRVLTRLGDFATGHPGWVLAGTGVLLVLGGLGVARVRLAHDSLQWFPETDPLRIASERIDAELEGVTTLEFIVDTGRENGLHEPAVLEQLSRAAQWARDRKGAIPVSSSISIVDVVKETNRALHENRADHYAIPASRALVAQELLLFEQSGSDDVEEVTDSRFQVARLTLRTPWVDAIAYPPFIEGISARFREILDSDATFYVTGVAELLGRAFHAMVVTLARSYAVALLVITPLMVFLIGKLGRGLVAMIPNLIPVFLTVGLMGWLDIPMDGATLLVGAIVLGVAVDDTIHFMHKFGRYLEDTGDPRRAVHETLMTTGSALLFTSLVLAAGFGTIALGYMKAVVWFGLLACFATLLAFVADIVLAPALMMLFTGRAGRSKERTSLPTSLGRGR